RLQVRSRIAGGFDAPCPQVILDIVSRQFEPGAVIPPPFEIVGCDISEPVLQIVRADGRNPGRGGPCGAEGQRGSQTNCEDGSAGGPGDHQKTLPYLAL